MSAPYLTVPILLLALSMGPRPPSRPPSFPDQMSGWRVAERTSYDRSNLFEFIDGGAEVYLAYDFRRAWVVTYERPGGPPIAAEAYDMGVGEDAYGVLSVDLTGEPASVGTIGRYGAGLLRFCKGRWFARVMAERETAETRAAVMAIGAHIAKGIPEETPRPDLLDLVPTQGLNPGSATFLHTRLTLNQLYYLGDENLLELGPETDAVLAGYGRGAGAAKLLIVRYPDRRRCLRGGARFAAGYLERSGPEKDEMLIEPVEGGRFAGLAVRPPHLVVVLDAADEGTARRLVESAAEQVTGGARDGR